jgi:hypothetical protein
LKGRCLQKLERIAEAKDCYKNLSKRYLDDPRPSLYLAELYLLDKNFEQNRLLLEQADQSHWLHKLEVLVRKSVLGEKEDPSLIDEKSFPEDSLKIKSNFYRIYTRFLEQVNDISSADSFIEKAIHLNADRFSNYEVKLSLIEGRIFSSIYNNECDQTALNTFLAEIEKVEGKFSEFGDIQNRSKAALLLKKLNVYRAKENLEIAESLVRKAFDLILKCYFDLYTEKLLVGILWGIYLLKENLNTLISYLNQTHIEISDQLSQILILQFNLHNVLFTEGKKFFNDKNNQKYASFIENLENNEHDKVIAFLNNNVSFAIGLVDSLHDLPELRKLIIENLPDDKFQSKDKLLLLLYSDEKDYDKAFEILKKLDLSNARYVESKKLLQIVQKKKAWEIEIPLIEKLLKHEKDPKIILNLKLHLFNAHNNLKDYLGVVKIGNEILDEQAKQNHLEAKNKELLLANTIQAYLRRDEDGKAYETLSRYKFLSITPEFKFSIETEVYFKNNLAPEAIASVISATKIKGILTPEEYASLFYLILQIEKQTNFDLQSLEKVGINCFVKLKNQERWYYIGEEEELDATKINNQHVNYDLFIGTRIGDTINFSSKYSSKAIVAGVELIYPYDKYIIWQSRNHFHKLSSEERWNGARMIEVPPKDNSIDTKYLEAFLQDEQEKRNPLFHLYCTQNIPLALLALNEGGLIQAIGRIVQERKGFIKCSTGVISEMEKQNKVANKIINENLPFYIDGTSALVLSEIGFLEKIYGYIPNIKIPQSVITMLLEVANRFRLVPGEGGTLGYARGQLVYSHVEKEKNELIRNNFKSSIKLLESNLNNIIAISSANKMDCLSESKVHPELCDACILSQNEGLPILTEDFLYLQMNEYETKKKAPEYFSSINMMRVLYEQGKISFEDFLMYFGYLSSYRFRFLTLNADDIRKAVLGDGSILKVQPSNIRNFNFSLTLSEEYGVSSKTTFNVLFSFLFGLIMDDSINVEITEAIYAEILYTLPKDRNKKEFGRMLLSVCAKTIKDQYKIILSATIQDKLTKLFQLNDLFDFGN